MVDIKSELIQKAKAVGIKIKPEQAQQFQRYMELLLEWNEKINLTAIVEPSEIVEKHFIDSIMLLSECDIKNGARVIDVGTGAGFPGIPLKIMRADIDLTLLDSTNKKLTFLNTVCNDLGIKVGTVHKRAEEAGLDKKMRESYDVAVSRAVAPMNILAEYCIPFIKMKGTFIAMKGPSLSEEMKTAEGAISRLGGECREVLSLSLPCGDERNIAVVAKTRFTPPEFPRHGSTISKHPLS